MISSNKVWRPFDSKMVDINTELALDKHKNVVFPRFLRSVTALTIAGC